MSRETLLRVSRLLSEAEAELATLRHGLAIRNALADGQRAVADQLARIERAEREGLPR
jgi:hypothetical protein